MYVFVGMCLAVLQKNSFILHRANIVRCNLYARSSPAPLRLHEISTVEHMCVLNNRAETTSEAGLKVLQISKLSRSLAVNKLQTHS